MTKQHFIALADVIRDIQTHEFWGLTEEEARGKDVAMSLVIERLADFCARQNAGFKRDRWFAYIEGKTGPNGGKR